MDTVLHIKMITTFIAQLYK